MRRKIYLICLALIIVGIVKYAYSDDVWHAKMRKVATQFNNLLPLISDNSPAHPLEGPEQVAELNELAKTVAGLKDHIRVHGGANSLGASDPIFPMIISDFSFDVGRAAKLYEAGQVQYAKSILRGSIAYCAACHTRATNKSSFEFPVFSEEAESLSLSERMNLMAANRRFRDAISLFQGTLDGQLKKPIDSFEFEKASQIAITILVRAEPNPDAASSIVKQIKKSKLISPSFSKELNGWTQALELWKKDRYPQLVIDEEYFALAKQLLARAKNRQKTPLDHSSDVDYLRATALLHKILMLNANTAHAPEIYLMLGQAYEALQDLGLWSLHEKYYEACIQSAPHSEISAKCYDGYVQSVTSGYTGGKGSVPLPREVKTKLSELKSLSELKINTKNRKDN